ncbi:hypothetical protein ACP4OV_022035 [Aristida adscensionis]
MAGGAGSSVARRIYLAVYNWVVFVGWFVVVMMPTSSCRAQVLYYAAVALLASGHGAVYAAVQRPLQLRRRHGVILHGVIGLVRSPISATLPQIGSRLFVTWGILWSFPEICSNILVTTLTISWCITEIIRYSFFGVKETFGFAPSWLLWLRYNTFMVLYPVGIFSEVALIAIALTYMKVSEKYYLRMPNKWNFSFDYSYLSIFAIVVYFPVRICFVICSPKERRHCHIGKKSSDVVGDNQESLNLSLPSEKAQSQGRVPAGMNLHEQHDQ